jgi:hypothetical protein
MSRGVRSSSMAAGQHSKRDQEKPGGDGYTLIWLPFSAQICPLSRLNETRPVVWMLA